jgi:SAM-dependent methyltransferase
LRAPAEDLPFEDATFDVAVSTLVLCGVDDQPRALRELRRVPRLSGQLLFAEHVRSGDPRLARSQDRMNGINRFVVGCDCNRPTLDSHPGRGLHRHPRRARHAAEGAKFARPASWAAPRLRQACRPGTPSSAAGDRP